MKGMKAESVRINQTIGTLRTEKTALEKEVSRLEKELQFGLVPPDPADSRNTIVEIRAGAGGDEAALFVGDLYRMYTHYATAQGWSHELMEGNAAELGGFRYPLQGSVRHGFQSSAS